MSTIDNLQEAFAGESQANRKYLFFAEKAEESGNRQLARLFRAAAEAETVHARSHLKVMNGINSDEENLRTAVSGEKHEFDSMYPGFIEQAVAEKNKAAERTFRYANEVEKIHHGLFERALEDLIAGKKAADAPFHVCPVCGNTWEGETPDTCPICGVPKDKFKKIY
ncbi:MAG TPA: rubrerythrin family protein [Acidobacteriota bacterium]|nr:rubrerythrin family protein [Acidobacteriota bacterium]